MKTPNLEKLIADNKWRDISEAPKDGQQYLVHDGQCIVMGEHPNDKLIVHDITSCGVSDITHFRPLPDDRLAEVCEHYKATLDALASLITPVVGKSGIMAAAHEFIIDQQKRAEEIAGGE